MPEYQLYCFAQSGNAYRAALMLKLIGADWEPRFVDYFGKGETRTPEYRSTLNEMGEVPVLAHAGKKLSQSGVILTYLAERSGKFQPAGEDERLETLRWLLFDKQKPSFLPKPLCRHGFPYPDAKIPMTSTLLG
jgi:glutathione S-transferase